MRLELEAKSIAVAHHTRPKVTSGPSGVEYYAAEAEVAACTQIYHTQSNSETRKSLRRGLQEELKLF